MIPLTTEGGILKGNPVIGYDNGERETIIKIEDVKAIVIRLQVRLEPLGFYQFHPNAIREYKEIAAKRKKKKR